VYKHNVVDTRLCIFERVISAPALISYFRPHYRLFSIPPMCDYVSVVFVLVIRESLMFEGIHHRWPAQNSRCPFPVCDTRCSRLYRLLPQSGQSVASSSTRARVIIRHLCVRRRHGENRANYVTRGNTSKSFLLVRFLSFRRMYPMLVRRENRSSASYLAGSPQLSWKSQIGGGLGMQCASTRVPVQGAGRGLGTFTAPARAQSIISVEKETYWPAGSGRGYDLQGVDLSSSGHVSLVILSFP
jgi:hypothetical protein